MIADYPVLKLKKGKEANLGFHHPWVFSGAIDESAGDALRDVAHGQIVWVADRNGRVIGTGTYSAFSMIAVRVFAFEQIELDATWIARAIARADAKRKLVGYGVDGDVDRGVTSDATTGYRVVFGESDLLPGLVVDRYADVCVIQISTAGMDALKSYVLAALTDLFHPRAIVERSDMAVRAEDHLPEFSGIVSGELASADERVAFLENGLRFVAPVLSGQKTGFFCDQKMLRARIEAYARGRRVLNLFSYSGAHGIAALRGGAVSVHNIDASQEALALCGEHARLNGFDAERMTTEQADLFEWLAARKDVGAYDMIILDPPALIKSKKDAEMGQKAYHFINRAAMRMAQVDSSQGMIFITSSCSHYLSEADFAFLLRRASVQAGKELSLLEIVRQSPDHPESVYVPEASYLKTFIFRIS